jgi:hypothetical protein
LAIYLRREKPSLSVVEHCILVFKTVVGYTQASKFECWRNAINAELLALDENKTWYDIFPVAKFLSANGCTRLNIMQMVQLSITRLGL